MIRKLFPLGFLLFLMSCSLEPRYRGPIVEVPGEWKSTQIRDATEESSEEQDSDSVSTSLVDDSRVENWWEIFHDDILNWLELQLLENNKDLSVAIQKVFESRAVAGVRGADLYPQLSLTPYYENIGALVKIFGLPTPPPGFPPPPTIIRTHQLFYILPLKLSYELDLWGKVKNTEKAALLDVEAQEMALRTTLLILTSDLAVNYFRLRAFDAQLKLLADTTKIRKDALDIIRDRYDQGFVNYSDVTRAESLFYNAESQYFDSLRSRALKENMIAVLIGVPPSVFTLEYNPLNSLPPSVPSGIPSEVLLKRPDLMEAEKTAASEHAMIGVAYASFYPSISLTGYLGYSSPDLRDFLTWKSRLWAFGGNMTAPIFDGYRNISNLDLAYARFHEASGTYQQRVLTAFKEVEDALVNIKLQAEEMDKLEKSAQSSKVTTEISMDRYLNGFVNYLDVADSWRMELEAQSGVIDLLGQQYVSTIELIKALGGSW